MRDPGSGFAWLHGARLDGRRLSHIGALTLLLASCSSAPLPPSPAPKGIPRTAVEPRRASLSYLAPPACPGDEGFLEHVRSRATSLQLEAEPLALSRPEQVHVSVEPDPSGEGWLGELRIVGPSALVREVRGARCDDVVAALALITVLRLERSDGAPAGSTGGHPGTTAAGEQTPAGEASAAGQPPAATDEATPRPPAEAALERPTPERPTPERPTPEEPTPEEPTPEEGEPETVVEERATPDGVTGEAPTAEAPVEEPAAPRAATEDLAEPSLPARASVDEVEESVDRAPSEDAASSEPLSMETSVFGHLGYSSMPSHAFKAALGAELRLGETVASWSGALSLALARGHDVSADGTSSLTLLTAELRLCPPGASLDADLWLRSCAQLSGGRLGLSLSPSRVLATTDVVRPWVALGPSVDAGLPLASGWTLRATSALMVHLIRDTFGRAPTPDDADPEARVPLYRPEAISLELLLGIGYAF